jgi:hypothetical protein
VPDGEVVADRARPPAAEGLIVVPAARHALEAIEDSAVLLTVAKRP